MPTAGSGANNASIVCAPCAGAAPYVTRHGFGYSVFEHIEDGIRSELTIFVALDAADVQLGQLPGADGAAAERGHELRGFAVSQPSLEDVYLRLTESQEAATR